MAAHNIVYKTFGSQWVIEGFSPYQKYLQLDRKVLRNAKRFIYVSVSTHNYEESDYILDSAFIDFKL